MIDETLSINESLALTLFDIGAVQFGKYTLHSGKKTTVYIDLRILVSFPEVLRQVAAVYHQFLDRLELKFDLLTAPPLAGLPIGTALCLEMNRPMIYPRKTAKSYGSGKAIEGVWSIGQTAVVIDDVVTSGDSIIHTIASLKASGLQVKDAVVFIDRQRGGVKMLETEGYRLYSVMTLSYLLSILRDHKKITQKQYSKALKSVK